MCKDFFCTIAKNLGKKCPTATIIERVVYVEQIPSIMFCGTMDMSEFSSICLDVIEKYGNQADLYLPDSSMKAYRYADVVADQNLEYVDSLVYVAEKFDCDDFARVAFGKGFGIAWTNVHALNWFIDENGKFWFIEPQNRRISDKLDEWQGNCLRFLLGA